ncbi:MAG: M23 family metallopeptidase [Firmicutes bacterium]|nr:M23 family metallopeptidase [Candidatus Colivicinus equi]
MISEKYGIVPIKESNITKGFGENGHNAIDIGWNNPEYTYCEVWAWKSGVVVANDEEDDTGFYVDIEHYNADGTKQVSHYVHLKKPGGIVKVGQEVKQGDVIGYRGSTGHSTGPHLHFCISKPYTGAYNKQFVRDNYLDPTENIYWSPNKKYYWTGFGRGGNKIKNMPPEITPVQKDTNKEQIYIKIDSLNMRSGIGTTFSSYGYAPIGYYNVLKKAINVYTWYEIAENVWVAQTKLDYAPYESLEYYPISQEDIDKAKIIKELTAIQTDFNNKINNLLGDLR